MIEFSDVINPSEIKLYACLFAGFTAISIVAHGRKAFDWSPSLRKSGLINLIFMKFNYLVGGVFLLLLFPITAGYEALNLPQVSQSFWGGIPTPIVWLILLLFYDLALYWAHRVLHVSWLWPMHAVHHSDTDMHFMTWSRGHVFEQSFIYACIMLATTWLGMPITEIFILAFIRSVHQHYVHSKLDWNHGPFHMLLVSPQFHRWHHADIPEAYDKNFASIFPFLDKMFGTYYNPGSAIDVPTGFPDAPGHNFMDLLFYPIREWQRMLTARAARRAAKVNRA